MPEMESTMERVLRAVEACEKEQAPVPPEAVAICSGLALDEVKGRLLEAAANGWTYYFNDAMETSLPTAPGWTLTPTGQDVLAAADNP